MHKAFRGAALAAALTTTVPLSAALARTTTTMQTMDMTGQGTNGFGKTSDFEAGATLEDVYSRGFYCDTSVPAKSQTGCEVGAGFKVPPAKNYDPLYITVPLGFSVPPMSMQCPTGLICIDHPATIDLSAIGGPTNAMTPGHDHFTATTNNFQPEWWDVQVIGVTSPATYADIARHRSFGYIQYLIKKGDKTVTQPVPTNLFLFFAVRPPQ